MFKKNALGINGRISGSELLVDRDSEGYKTGLVLYFSDHMKVKPHVTMSLIALGTFCFK